MIGLRELQSRNSWMHNSARLMPQRRVFGARIHPIDAMAAGLEQGDDCVISSPTGSIRAPVMVTEDVSSGTIAVPHGWGHTGGWQRANTAGGAHSNDLATRTDEGRGGKEGGMKCRNRGWP